MKCRHSDGFYKSIVYKVLLYIFWRYYIDVQLCMCVRFVSINRNYFESECVENKQ